MSARPWFLLLAFAFGCHKTVDADNDGSPSTEDCDDADAAVHPGADEVCDGIDNDCDDQADDADDDVDATTGQPVFADADGDGFGDAATSHMACDPGDGETADGTDCDDADEDRNPDADEICNGLDDDCDDLDDENDPDAIGLVIVYDDVDGDGYGDPDTAATACPDAGVQQGGDCDDGNEAISPAATEVCIDGVDDDCDGTADDGCPTCLYLDILSFYDSYSGTTPLAEGAALLGATVTETSSDQTFADDYDATAWDLVVIDVPGSSLPADVNTRVSGRAAAGGPIVFSFWALDTDSALQASLGVTVTSTYDTPMGFGPTSTGDLWTRPQSVPDPLTNNSHEAGVDGLVVTPVTPATTEVLATYTDQPDDPAVLTTLGGHVLMNTFLPWDWQASDDDTDGQHDMAELYANEIVHVTGCVP